MKLKIKICIAILFGTSMVKSQIGGTDTTSSSLMPGRQCATKVPPVEWEKWFSSKTEEYRNQQSAKRDAAVNFVIPVVVHVIHGGQPASVYPNVMAEQVYTQIRVLNDDFGGIGLNSQNLSTTGFSLVGVANTRISFCLAQIDPQGNPLVEPGIDRINYKTKGWADPASIGSVSGFQDLIDDIIKPNTIWDPRFYFNIWISDVSSSLFLLGYATFPSGSGLTGVSGTGLGTSTDDGIWIWSKAFGTVGTLIGVYNKGRSAVHETGHWLGLRHIGGDPAIAGGDCSATDYCNDTPAQKGGANGGSNGQNFGSPVYPLHVNVCGSAYGDMFMNFMDYTDDKVMSLFSPDQAVRMQTAMDNAIFRKLLTASSATQCTVNFLGTESHATNENDFDVFPNPGSGVFTLEYRNTGWNDLKIKVHNALGKELESHVITFEEEGRLSLHLENYPDGLYTISCARGEVVTVKKVIICKGF